MPHTIIVDRPDNINMMQNDLNISYFLVYTVYCLYYYSSNVQYHHVLVQCVSCIMPPPLLVLTTAIMNCSSTVL